MSQQNQKSMLSRSQFPFYKTYIDFQCRKDILTQNQHANKKVKSKITPFFHKISKKAKQNKFRLAYFFGFVVIFKLQPVYDYFFCHSKAMNWVYNNWINYYLDWTQDIPKSAIETNKQRKLINKSQNNRKLAQIFYSIDQNPRFFIGFNPQNGSFVNSKQQEISLDKFVQICNSRFQGNISQIQLNLRNVFNSYQI